MSWNQGDEDTASAAIALSLQLRNEEATTSGYSNVTVFVNYAHRDKKLEYIYGEDDLPRLADLKRTGDPSHVFGYNNRLPTQYP